MAFKGRAKTQAVSSRSVIQESRVRWRGISSEICSGMSGTGTSFSPSPSVPLSVQFHQRSTLIFIYMLLLLEGHISDVWELSTKRGFFVNWGSFDRKLLSFKLHRFKRPKNFLRIATKLLKFHQGSKFERTVSNSRIICKINAVCHNIALKIFLTARNAKLRSCGLIFDHISSFFPSHLTLKMKFHLGYIRSWVSRKSPDIFNM
jgi:hypothetical protein